MNHRRASRLPQSLESSTSFRPRRQELAEPRTISTGVIDQTEPPSRSGLLRKKYYFCTVEPACMNHDQTYRPVRRVPAPRLRDADGSISQAPCRSAGYAATHPVQPLKGLPGTRATDVSYRALAPGGAGTGRRVCTGTSESRLTAHYSLLTANSTYTFSAKEKDPETGLSYFGSRYYSSDLSVWLSVDPMSDDYPYQSNYVYCSNNPLMIVDPNGMFETRAEAQKYRKEHHTGGSIHKRSKHDNYSGNYSIVNRRTNTSYTKPQYQEESSVPTSGMGDDGVVTSAVISSKSLNSDANYTISSSEITSLPSNTNIMSSTATACLLLASDD